MDIFYDKNPHHYIPMSSIECGGTEDDYCDTSMTLEHIHDAKVDGQ